MTKTHSNKKPVSVIMDTPDGAPSETVTKPKRVLTEAQRLAFLKGREKRLDNIQKKKMAIKEAEEIDQTDGVAAAPAPKPASKKKTKTVVPTPPPPPPPPEPETDEESEEYEDEEQPEPNIHSPSESSQSEDEEFTDDLPPVQPNKTPAPTPKSKPLQDNPKPRRPFVDHDKLADLVYQRMKMLESKHNDPDPMPPPAPPKRKYERKPTTPDPPTQLDSPRPKGTTAMRNIVNWL
jgi:hypothetical protein